MMGQLLTGLGNMGRRVRAWILPWEGQYNGPYLIPSSEQSYRENKALLDMVLPAYGGLLLPDTGEWVRHNCIGGEFATYLLNTSRETNQAYLPAVTPFGATIDSKDLFLALLEEPRRWPAIADGLVEMALTDFDAPWSGVLYDWPDIPADKVRAQERFATVLSRAARANGLPFAVAFRGIVPGDEDWSPSLDVLRDITDQFDYYMYTYWNLPYSPSPFWWAESSIQNALRHGFESKRIYLGLFLASWYYDTAAPFHYWITHDQAMQIVRENGATVNWVEDHPAGLIREKYAAIGRAGHLWIEDGDTVRARLALVDKYGLGGVMLFVLGCESESVWQAIAEWKRPKRTRPAGMSSRIGANGGYLVPSGRAVSWPTRP